VAATPTALYVEAANRTGRGLYRIPLANGQPAGAPVRVSDDARFVSAFAATPNADVVAFLAETSTAPADVYVSPTARFVARRLTDVNPEASSFALGEQRVVRLLRIGLTVVKERFHDVEHSDRRRLDEPEPRAAPGEIARGLGAVVREATLHGVVAVAHQAGELDIRAVIEQQLDQLVLHARLPGPRARRDQA
jgi:hypothetical protein